MGTINKPKHSKKRLGPLPVLLMFSVVNLVILTVARFLFMIWQGERVLSVQDYEQIYIGGLRIDVSTLAYLMAPALLLIIVGLVLNKLSRVRIILKGYLLVTGVAVLFFEMITPTFIIEYDLRPNRLFIDYLIYPNEVISMLWGGYKLEALITFVALFMGYKLFNKLFDLFWSDQFNIGWMKHSLVHVCAILAIVLGARGTLAHRPINPALVAFSTDHLLNELSLNSIYSVGFAWQQLRKEISSEEYYGALPKETILNEIYKTQQNKSAAYLNDKIPTQTYHLSSYPERKKNLVILLQESLGARYVGKLGGLPLTPNLDKLMDEGWNFTRLYATGTRSVRGIEAIMTGFTPTSSRAVVKLDKSQKNFFTLASFLGKQGYHTQFIYGGESHFDNMKSFFLGNGVTDIVDRPRFNKIDFEGSWGASDEDLYDQADLEFTQLAKEGKPFFSLVFTSSNHSPYDYPEGKITPYDSPDASRNNAAKYSDYALGKFVEKAKQSNYWDNTIFIVIADHDSRVSGSELVPVEHFRIPGVIFGKDIQPQIEPRLASQIDLPPTLLSLIGASGNHPMLGNDFTKPIDDGQPRALLQYDKNFAYLKSDKAVILQPSKEPLTYAINQHMLTPTQQDDTLVKEAHAYANFGSIAYREDWYQP